MRWRPDRHPPRRTSPPRGTTGAAAADEYRESPRYASPSSSASSRTATAPRCCPMTTPAGTTSPSCSTTLPAGGMRPHGWPPGSIAGPRGWPARRGRGCAPWCSQTRSATAPTRWGKNWASPPTAARAWGYAPSAPSTRPRLNERKRDGWGSWRRSEKPAAPLDANRRQTFGATRSSEQHHGEPRASAAERGTDDAPVAQAWPQYNPEILYWARGSAMGQRAQHRDARTVCRIPQTAPVCLCGRLDGATRPDRSRQHSGRGIRCA